MQSVINHKIKFSWDDPAEQAPIPHAEIMTLADLAKKADLDLDEIIVNLKAADMEPAKPETVLNQLSKKYDLAPSAVYNIATGQKAIPKGPADQGSCQGQRRGLGVKTLKQFCEEEGVDLQAAIDILSDSQISASPDETLRQLADKALTSPGQIATIITSPQSE